MTPEQIAQVQAGDQRADAFDRPREDVARLEEAGFYHLARAWW